MENKNKLWKGILIGSMATAFTGLIIVGMAAGIWVVGRGVIENRVQAQTTEVESARAESDDLDLNRIQAKMGLLQEYVSQYYLFEEDPQKVEDGIYYGFMAGLEDPYSVYYTEEDFNELMEATEGVYCGIGAMVSQDRTTGVMTIAKVFEGTPSHEAGMQPGDVLYKVDEEEVTGIELDLVVKKYIKGKEGTTVVITVLRPGVDDYLELKMARREIEVPTVEHQMLEGKIGRVTVSQFDTITPTQFQQAIEDLESQGMEKLIVDLRNNPGGVLESVVEMLAYVLPEDKLNGMLVYTQDKYGKGDQYFCQGGKIRYKNDYEQSLKGFPREDDHEIKVPMAVLVNGDSASASEVFAGAVKDYGVGKLVGTTTFGKGIVQNVIQLSDGTAIKLTTSHYFTPSGFGLHEKGIEPDVVVELNEGLKTKAVIEVSEDNQLQKAIEILNK